ncbi:MAG: glycosyltransferase [Paludibacter sp.]
MKKVLIITYYWIPSGGSGVQRWVKFVKYLREFGWEPIIYTPENPEFPSLDHSFESDIPTDITVLKTPIWEPYNVYRKLTHKENEPIKAGFISENKKHGWKDKLSVWIRGNFLIPDPRRFWIRPSVKFLTSYLNENPVDAIITTGPPHSMHFIGLGLKKNFPNLPWIADFRDPWTNIFFYKDLKIGWLADKIHHRLERKIIQSTDCLLVVSQGMKDEFEVLLPKRLEIISNGYDDTDFQIEKTELDKKFSISHIGLLTPKQNPYILWKVLSEICYDNEEFRSNLEIQLVGNVDFSVLQSLSQFGLEKQLNKIAYLPHNEAIVKQQASQILLLLLMNEPGNKCILTGKLFEYLAAKRPVMAFGPTDGDAASVLYNANAGEMIDFEDEKTTRNLILNYYSQFKDNKLYLNSKSVERFTRKSLTSELAMLLNNLK